mgnify:CR=1 FL=1
MLQEKVIVVTGASGALARQGHAIGNDQEPRQNASSHDFERRMAQMINPTME